jgi:hypothetical protein
VSREGERVRITAMVIRPDGTDIITATELSGDGICRADRSTALSAMKDLGRKTADSLRQKGAEGILRQVSDAATVTTPEAP